MKDGFKIIGISTRTTNKNSQALQDLGALWGRFFSEAVAEKIPHKISDEILAIYTDYQSDYTEEYTTIIGMKVSSLDDIPVGMVGREFSAENFQLFTAKGEMPKAVGEKWMEIWSQDSQLKRKYTYDYEVYSAKSQNGENSEVDIFVAVE